MPFDPSTDYASYPTLAPLSDDTPSASAFISCPFCGGIAFRLRRTDRVPVCIGCAYTLEPEDTQEEAIQEVAKLQQVLKNMIQQREPEQEQSADLPPVPKVTAGSSYRFQVVRGANHTVVLRPDGTVKAVGDNKNGQCNVQDWENIKAIATNQFYTVGLCENGTLRIAGGGWLLRSKLSDWKNVTAIAVGGNFLVARCSDGTVKAAGIRLSAWSGITDIAAGTYHIVALCEDGSLRAVGSAAHGMCKIQDWTRIKAIALGDQHTVGLCEDGTVRAVGFRKRGKFEKSSRCDVQGWTNITAIAAGSYHTVGLRSNGRVCATGFNKDGQCDVQE